MKKIFFLAAITLAAASCLKDNSVVVESEKEINFKAMTNVATKADAQLEGNILTADYRIYASATQRKADGIVENKEYFRGLAFDTEDAEPTITSTYHAWDVQGDKKAPIYWPVGGCVLDYLAYAMPVEAYGVAPIAEFDGEEAASHLVFKAWNTYDNQVDVLYAVKNGATTAENAGTGKTVGLNFKHAQALLVFEAKINEGCEGLLQINKIEFVTDVTKPAEQQTLLVQGDFVVDNSKNNLEVKWENLKSLDKKNVVAPGADPDDDYLHDADDPNDTGSERLDNKEYDQVGSTLLIPQQPAINFIVYFFHFAYISK